MARLQVDRENAPSICSRQSAIDNQISNRRSNQQSTINNQQSTISNQQSAMKQQ
jgi:hypothetical protein